MDLTKFPRGARSAKLCSLNMLRSWKLKVEIWNTCSGLSSWKLKDLRRSFNRNLLMSFSFNSSLIRTDGTVPTMNLFKQKRTKVSCKILWKLGSLRLTTASAGRARIRWKPSSRIRLSSPLRKPVYKGLWPFAQNLVIDKRNPGRTNGRTNGRANGIRISIGPSEFGWLMIERSYHDNFFQNFEFQICQVSAPSDRFTYRVGGHFVQRMSKESWCFRFENVAKKMLKNTIKCKRWSDASGSLST